jgi:HK97 family phage prohead protease
MAIKVETRTIAVTELRAGPAFEVAGRAASYNMLSQDLGGFVERLQPGCFSRSLRNGDDVVCCVNHDPSQLLGRTRNKTLTLNDSEYGLDFVCKLNPSIQAHKDLHAAVRSGLLDSCSFAFGVDEGGDTFDTIVDPNNAGRSIARRTIRSAKLFDTSIVTHPAYPGDATNVNARQFRSCDYGLPMQTQRFAQHILQTPQQVDAENRKRLLAIGTMICRDKSSNDLITDFELRQKGERIGAIIEKDEREEAFAELRRELGVE